MTGSGLSATFVATKSGKYYVQATAGTFTSNMATITVADDLAKLVSVKQTKRAVLELTCDKDASLMKEGDLVITNTNGKRVNVKKNTLDSTKKIVTVETLINMDDGDEYTVKYNDTEVKFTATTGEVYNVLIEPTTAPINTDVKITAKAIDAHEVILESFTYGSAPTYSDGTSYDFNIDFPDGGGSDDRTAGIIRMETVGAKAEAVVTYTSNKVDANGSPISTPYPQTIVAIEEGNISTYKDVKFLSLTDGEKANITDDIRTKKFSAYKEDELEKNVRTGGIKANSDTYLIKGLVLDDLQYTKVDGSFTEAGYTLSSADETVALVEGDTIKGVKEGDTAILVSKDDKVILNIPVRIDAKSVLTSIEFDKPNVYLTAADVSLPSKRYSAGHEDKTGKVLEDYEHDYDTVTVKAYDQYKELYLRDYTVTFEGTNDSSKNTDVMEASVNNNNSDNTHTVTIKATVEVDQPKKDDSSKYILERGASQSNQYKITAEDSESDNKVSKTLSGRVSMPRKEESKLAIEVSKGTSNVTVDTTVKSYENDGMTENNKAVTVRLGVYDSNNTLCRYAYLPTLTSITVKKDNSTLTSAGAFSLNTLSTTADKASGKGTAKAYEGHGEGIVEAGKFVPSSSGSSSLYVGNADAVAEYVDNALKNKLNGDVIISSDGAIGTFVGRDKDTVTLTGTAILFASKGSIEKLGDYPKEVKNGDTIGDVQIVSTASLGTTCAAIKVGDNMVKVYGTDDIDSSWYGKPGLKLIVSGTGIKARLSVVSGSGTNKQGIDITPCAVTSDNTASGVALGWTYKRGKTIENYMVDEYRFVYTSLWTGYKEEGKDGNKDTISKLDSVDYFLTKASTGRYEFSIPGVKFVKDNLSQYVGKEDGYGYTRNIDYNAKKTEIVKNTIIVKDSQAAPNTWQEYAKTSLTIADTSEAINNVAMDTLRVTVDDAVGNYIPREANKGYTIHVPRDKKKLGYRITNSNALAFTRVYVYVPYQSTKNGKIALIRFEQPLSCTVNPQ